MFICTPAVSAGEKQAMDEIEHRQRGRDNLFLMADLRLLDANGVGADGEHRVRIRNLSAGGVMAEGNVKVGPGTRLEVALSNIGWVAGTVAWIQDNRFGIAFAQQVDPERVQASDEGSL